MQVQQHIIFCKMDWAALMLHHFFKNHTVSFFLVEGQIPAPLMDVSKPCTIVFIHEPLIKWVLDCIRESKSNIPSIPQLKVLRNPGVFDCKNPSLWTVNRDLEPQLRSQLRSPSIGLRTCQCQVFGISMTYLHTSISTHHQQGLRGAKAVMAPIPGWQGWNGTTSALF